MASLEELRQERLRKLEILKEKGIDPYPSGTRRNLSIESFLKDFDAYSENGKWLSGRIMSLRTFGALIFAQIFDGTAYLQVVFKKENLSEESFNVFVETIDRGDFIEVFGTSFTTQKGEKSILVTEWGILGKGLRPLPEKWHGLENEEERLRKRYLDLLTSDESRSIFKQKALFWQVAREFLEKNGFIEVHTPTLELTTGGAEATPFKTHHEDFDIDVFLRISVGELWQKRLMAAGFSRTYEIGRVYRNEGSSPEHLQEFTNLEFYAAFLNFEDGKKLVQELYRTIAQEVFGKTEFVTRGHTFDFSKEWEDLDYVSTIEKMTGVNVLDASQEGLKTKLDELGVKYEGDNKERLTDSLWKYCRKQISGPAFLINHPKLVAPLSKEHPEDNRLTKTFQVIIAGSEIGRAHAELNDPIDQAQRFEMQKKLIESGDTEAMMPDYEFVEMLEYGMPPTFGFGFGERLFSFLVDKPIREVTLFPLLKPKQE